MDALMLMILWIAVVPFLILCSVLTVVLILALLLLVREPGKKSSVQAFDEEPHLENLSALHCRHFPQLRQVLSRVDEDFLRQRMTAADQRKWCAERRRVAKEFLRGLHVDFVRLDRLARTVAALSPEVSRSQEAQRVWLGMRFRMSYRLVAARLAIGSLAPSEVVHLADMVGSYAAKIETTMAALEQHSLSGVGANFGV
jgi:hypothetical protein